MILYQPYAGASEEPIFGQMLVAGSVLQNVLDLLRNGEDFDHDCRIDDIEQSETTTTVRIRMFGETADKYTVHVFEGPHKEMDPQAWLCRKFFRDTGLGSAHFAAKMANELPARP